MQFCITKRKVSLLSNALELKTRAHNTYVGLRWHIFMFIYKCICVIGV